MCYFIHETKRSYAYSLQRDATYAIKALISVLLAIPTSWRLFNTHAYISRFQIRRDALENTAARHPERVAPVRAAQRISVRAQDQQRAVSTR